MKAWSWRTGTGATVVAAEGEVDGNTAPDLEKTLSGLLLRGSTRLALDVSRVAYLSSAGLRALAKTHSEARRLGGELRLFGASNRVRLALEMAGLDGIIALYPGKEAALEGW